MRAFCLNCLWEGYSEIEVSSRGLPFLKCAYCRSNVFWHTKEGFVGYLAFVPRALATVREMLSGEPVTDSERRYYQRLARELVPLFDEHEDRKIAKHGFEPSAALRELEPPPPRVPKLPGGVFCMCCLNETAEIRVSKNKLPYLTCHHCKCRIFWNTSRGLLGYKKIAPVAFAEARKRLALGEPPRDEETERYHSLEERMGRLLEEHERERPFLAQGEPARPSAKPTRSKTVRVVAGKKK